MKMNLIVIYSVKEEKCKIIKLDLWGLDEGKGMAFVHFDKPVKKTERREVDADSVWGLDRDDSLPMHE